MLIYNDDFQKIVLDICSESFGMNINNPDNVPDFHVFLKDIVARGCVTGIINNFCYRSGSVKFYEENISYINDLFSQLSSDDDGFNELYGADAFDHEDYLFLKDNNKELLAWFVFREVVRQIIIFNNIK